MAEVKLYKLQLSGSEIDQRFALVNTNFEAIQRNFTEDSQFRTLVENTYATINYVDERFAELIGNAPAALDTLNEIATVLATKEDASAITSALELKADKTDLANYQPVGEYLTEHQSLENYATKAEVDAVEAKIDAILEGSDASLDTLKELVDLINTKQSAQQVLDAIANKVDRSELAAYQPVGEYLTEHQSLEGYATEDYLEANYQPKGDYLTEHQDISGLATIAEVEANYQPKGDYLTEHQDISGLATIAEVEANYQPKGDYLTEHQSLDDYATKADVEANYQPKGEYLTEHQDLSAYATSADVEANYQPKGEYLTEHQDISGLATKAEVEANYQPKGEYLTAHQDLTGYATETYVDNKISNLVDGAPEALDTLNEIAAELANKEDATAIATALALKADKSELANYLTEHQDISGLATKAEVEANYQHKGEYLTEHQDLSAYATSADVEANYQPKGEYLTEHQSLDAYATKAEVAEGYQPIGEYLTEHQSLEDYALKADLDNYVEKKVEESDSYDYIYDEASWNASFANGALKKYYTKYPDEDRYNTQAHRWAYASDKVDGEWPEYCIQCWEGAVNAAGAKFPWICPNFDEDVNSSIVFEYEGMGKVYPWGSTVFGSTKTWGIASVAEEFQYNGFLIPDNAGAANENWTGEPANDFDVAKFKMYLVKQDDVESVKAYVDSEVARVESEIPAIPTAVSAFENDADYLTEHQSLEGYATEEFVTSYVVGAINDLVDGAPEALNTLNEIATKLNETDSASAIILNELVDKANKEDVYDKTAADGKFVEKSKYDELNDKYTNLFNYVYSQASGAAATPLNANYVENNLSNTNTSVEITEGELGDVTIPEVTKTMTVTAPMQDGATVTLSSPRAINLINTSDEPVDVTIDAPAGTSIPTMSLSGDFENLTVNNGSVGAKSGADPLTAYNVTIENEIGKNANISGVVFHDDATITSYTVPSLGVANNNTDQDAPNATINAENSTVTLNKGQWNSLNSNVSYTTLIVTGNAHINTLNVIKGNVLVYDREIENRIDNVVNNTEYTVSLRTTDVTTGNEINSALTGNPGIVNMKNDISRGRITWGIFGAGNYLLDLQGHTLTLSDATFGLKTRNAVNLKIVDTVGGGKFINDKAYGLWAGENTVITVDVPESTEIVGVTHTLYCEGSGKPAINVINGTYKMIIEDSATDVYDANGNYKFMLNHYDATYTREGNCFNITGGTFYGFDPARMNGDPGAEYSMIDLNEYESQVVDTFVDSRGTTMNVYKVVKK